MSNGDVQLVLERLDKIDNRLDKMDGRIDNLTGAVERLRDDQNAIRVVLVRYVANQLDPEEMRNGGRK